MIETITWEEGVALIKESLDAQLAAAPDLEYAYSLALNDFYEDVSADLTEDERKTWHISSTALKHTACLRVQGMTVREAYDAGMTHARTFDHTVLRALSDMSEAEERIMAFNVAAFLDEPALGWCLTPTRT